MNIKITNKYFYRRDTGFIAITSAVIISAIMLGFLFTTNRTTFSARFDALDGEFKHVASGLAESCVNQALLKLAQDYSYDPTNALFSIDTGDCYIVSITPHAPRTGNSTDVTITTRGSYKNTFSNYQTKATVWNPTSPTFTPPPSCYLTISPTSISSGQVATLLWSVNNATGSQLSIVATSNSANTVSPINISTSTASGSVSRTPSASETWVGTISGPGGSSQCSVPTGSPAPSVIVQPPPTCADTVMILDRSGSMSNTDLNNEGNAAKALVTLYQNANPQGKVGVGSFGAYPNQSLPAGSASVPTNGQLSFNYSTLTSMINSITGSNSSVGSNLADAITVGSNELNSVRHDVSKAKVLILVSDGEANEPSGTSNYDTGFKSPSIDAQNGTGDVWSTPNGAYADAGADANDPVSENDRHRFYNFAFPVIPSGATIRGIEIKTDAWNTTTTTTNSGTNIIKSPSGTISPSQWSNPTQAFSSNDSYATNSNNGQQQAYSNFGFNIPTNATITGIQISTEAKVSSASPVVSTTLIPITQGSYTSWTNGISAIDETGTPNCNSTGEYIFENTSNDRESFNLDISSIPNGATITDVTVTSYDRGDSNSGGTYKTFAVINGNNYDASTTLSAGSTSGCNTKTQTIDVFNTVKSGSTDLEIGVVKVSGNSNAVRVGALRATVTYIPQNSGSLTVALSSNNGGSWTTTKTVTLGTTDIVSSPTGNSATDLWSRTWVPADFNDGNFALRITNTTTSGTTVSLDQVVTNVFYSVPTPVSTICQLGMDLSWNAGSSWTTEKLQNLSNTETTYTLGSSSDDWSTTHTWLPTEFTDANFRARVRAIDPGSACDNLAVDHLDWLQARVHYTQSLNPSTAATNSANTAKLNGVDVFTIHFGATSGRNFLATLASGASDNDAGTSTTTASRDAENNDGDNFFISPSSADMTNIFQSIGTKVCPAALAPPVPPTPPSPPPPPPPPPNITIGSWIETP